MKYDRKDDVLNYFVDQLRNQLGSHLKKVVLFGSKSRGDDVPGSDYDCLVVVDVVSEEIKDVIDEVAGDTLFHYNAVFSAFLISEEKFQRKTYNLLLMNINKEGVVI